MFKNLMLYQIAAERGLSAERVHEALNVARFQSPSPSQEVSIGWVSPRPGNEQQELLVVQDQDWLIACQREKRLLPPSAVNERLEALSRQVEAATGRKPGSKARKELKERARAELMPNALTSKKTTLVWISWPLGILAIATTSASECDDIVSMLVKSVAGVSVMPLSTEQSPGVCMTAWLQDGDMPEHFTCDRDCELRASNELRSVVRYTRHNLDIEAVKEHLVEGMAPTALAMTYKDRVSFVLTDALQVRKVKILDLAFEDARNDKSDDAFAADFTLARGELSELLKALVNALGGRIQTSL